MVTVPSRGPHLTAIHFLSLGIPSPCQLMIGVYNHFLSKVFRFQIGFLGYEVLQFFLNFDMLCC